MGGSGGGTFSNSRTPEKIQQDVRSAERKTIDAAYEAEVNEKLGSLLSSYNERDTELVQQRLDELRVALEDGLEQTVNTVFGGSVAKHTYVDGISDVDTLAILNATKLSGSDPKSALKALEKMIRTALPNGARLEAGRIAITITYSDGMQLQVLPAIRVDEGLRVPAWRANQWSTIDPEAFRQGLSKRNEQCAGKLIPILKLVKGINAKLPEDLQLSGYHIESLGIAAFRGYKGSCTYTRMLEQFFERAQELVMQPMKDRTGQSVRVDDYLGAPGGEQRQKMRTLLSRIAKRIRNASASQSAELWVDLFAD